MRDILINDMPLFFRKDIYATACLLGGVAYWLTSVVGFSPVVQQVSCAIVVIGLRVLAVYYGWSLPRLKTENGKHEGSHVACVRGAVCEILSGRFV